MLASDDSITYMGIYVERERERESCKLEIE